MKTHAQVVCAVGAPETELLDPSAPKRIDGEGTIALVDAADTAGVQQVGARVHLCMRVLF